jgi:DNA invertase Pin-like site-specific DNA recombinase
MSNVIGYRRVSTTDQNLDRQDLGDDVARVFEEKLSGKDRERPQLAACLTYLRDGDTLRVHSVDRLGRSLSDLLAIVAEVVAKGASVEFLKERLLFDPKADDPYSRMQLQLLGVFSEFERAIILARQAEGIALAKQRGVYKGRAPKLGPAEVRTLRERRTLGVPIPRLCKDFGVSKSTVVDALGGVGVYGRAPYRAETPSPS